MTAGEIVKSLGEAGAHDNVPEPRYLRIWQNTAKSPVEPGSYIAKHDVVV